MQEHENQNSFLDENEARLIKTKKYPREEAHV